MATTAGVQIFLEPVSASVMPKASFVEKINLFLFAISFSHHGEVIFHKDMVLCQKTQQRLCSSRCQENCSAQYIGTVVDGKTSTLHKAFYPALKVDFRSNQALRPCSWSKLAALHPSGILWKFCFPIKWWSVTETPTFLPSCLKIL